MFRMWMQAAAVTSALCLALACGDDDDNQGGTGGSHSSGGKGSSGEANGGGAGENSGGSSNSGAGENSGGAAAGSGAGGVGGGVNGGAGGEKPMCDPPDAPSIEAGGAGGSGGEASGALAIAGDYVDEYQGMQTISSSEWSGGTAVFHIAAFDNGEHWIVARNDQANDYNACAWSRFEWTEADGKLYYCQSVYAADSEREALEAPRADPSDPAHGGCSSFPWTEMTRQ